MTNTKICFAALALLAASLGAVRANAQYTPAETFYTAGSSAQFNTFGVAASFVIPPSSFPLCGANHWSKKNSSALPITIVDPRGSVVAEPANIWIAWDNNAQNGVAGQGVVCYFASVDSIVGVRAYFAHATVSLAAGLVGTAGANLVPLIGTDGTLPQSIYNIVNNSLLTAANTDIRPEDAKFATMRTLTTLGAQVTGRAVTGLGYHGTGGGIGTAIKSSQSATVANPVDFSMVNGDPDPIVGATNPWREYIDLPIGAAPVMVVVNVSNVATGHLGDGTITNINRFILAKVLEGKITHIRDLGYTATPVENNPPTYNYPPTTPPDEPLHVFIREPLSGTYNTMEFSIPNSLEIDATTFTVGQVNGQETGVTPSNTGCTVTPCTVESGNPLWHIGPNGYTRGRAIGTGEMVTAVNGTADGIGYAFWGLGNFQGKTNLKYLTVDGVDPLYSGPASNPGGVGVLPGCTLTGGLATSCPVIPFPNIINGTYPIWSKYRMLYDPTVSSTIASAITLYAQNASNPAGSALGVIGDMLPAYAMQVFHSHYAQVVEDSGVAIGPNNGFKTGVPETGGDMGGAVLTIQSELDFINDTGGNQQVNLFQ